MTAILILHFHEHFFVRLLYVGGPSLVAIYLHLFDLKHQNYAKTPFFKDILFTVDL